MSNLKNPAPNQPLNPKLERAVNEEAKSRAASLLTGVLRYSEIPYKRDVSEQPCVWQRGSARLLDYGSIAGSNAPLNRVVLFIPSLINRYYILDLEEERSMLRHMVTQGIYPLVLDWGQPASFEAKFDCADYVTEILMPAIEFISTLAGERITLAGYCMGGVMAMAAAQLKKKYVSSLAFFATPWDFHCDEFQKFLMDDARLELLKTFIHSQRTLSADFVQALFYVNDPFVFEQKFRRFADLAPDSRAAKDFIALEHWVNDGVPMTSKVAEDCMIGWTQHNQLFKKQWEVGGKKIEPKKLELPTFMAIPQNDHVVPMECAMALAKQMPHATLTHPGAGHVGMIVGSRAKRELWQPFADWLNAL